ncbi:MAG: NAD(P)-dependent oxidoreductase, partial [Gammaproteobacteria bacterium]|nr:NAD(P)-dependent oxidoreductase [Gammaproteobacteria bacterium]
MKILITGQRGYLGSHVYRSLLQKYPSKVVALDEDKTSTEAYRRSIWDSVGSVKKSLDFTHIIHIGAASHTRISTELAFEANYRATQILSECLPNAYFMFFSSCAANDPVTTSYGFSKRAASDWLFSTRDQVCVFVPYNIYGKEVGRTKKYSNPEYIVRGQVEYVTKPFVRDYIHVDDCLRMIHHALSQEACGVFEMGTGVGYDFDQLCEIGKLDISGLRHDRPGDDNYPPVGPADRVAKSPYLETKICVKAWIEKHTASSS